VLLFPHGAAKTPAELVVAYDATRKAGAVAECVVGVEYVVAEELIRGAMEAVGTRQRDDADLTPHCPPIGSRWNLVHHREFAHRFIGRLEVDHAVLLDGHRHTVEQEIVGAAARSVYAECP